MLETFSTPPSPLLPLCSSVLNQSPQALFHEAGHEAIADFLAVEHGI